jgi:DNA-binding beta-propeller fold protein YncE
MATLQPLLLLSCAAMLGPAALARVGGSDVALITDYGAGRLVVFDAGTETVLGSIDIGLTPGLIEDCPGKVAVSADGTLGLATDGENHLWLIDLAAAALAPGVNPITTISLAYDVAFDVSEGHAVVSGGNFFLSSVDLAARQEVAFLDISTLAAAWRSRGTAPSSSCRATRSRSSATCCRTTEPSSIRVSS